jgi:hypothetical protein
MTLDARWYRCTVTDSRVDAEEPDWSKVPEAKRDAVRDKWRAAHLKEETTTWWLWGPQIAFLQKFSHIVVEL